MAALLMHHGTSIFISTNGTSFNFPANLPSAASALIHVTQLIPAAMSFCFQLYSMYNTNYATADGRRHLDGYPNLTPITKSADAV